MAQETRSCATTQATFSTQAQKRRSGGPHTFLRCKSYTSLLCLSCKMFLPFSAGGSLYIGVSVAPPAQKPFQLPDTCVCYTQPPLTLSPPHLSSLSHVGPARVAVEMKLRGGFLRFSLFNVGLRGGPSL